MDAQQNMYNVEFNLANALATAGVAGDGDMLFTKKLSIGCDATSRTALPGNVFADELGLNGRMHILFYMLIKWAPLTIADDHFEGDASLTRNDYFTAEEPGNNYKYNNTLFTMMMKACNGDCNVKTLSKYRQDRWEQSKAENPHFYFGAGSLLIYGAATFLYELFPSAESIGSGDEATMMSFFGANKDANGNYYWNGGERLPPNWRPRIKAYDDIELSKQIVTMYLLNVSLVVQATDDCIDTSVACPFRRKHRQEQLHRNEYQQLYSRRASR